MKQKLFGIMLLLLFALSMQGQRSMADINRIKRDKSYLYGEATLDKKEAALKLAYELLEAEIKNWAQQKSANISSVIASHIYDYADTIILSRGNMVRAFTYVKVSDLKSVKGKEMVVKIKDPVVTTDSENKSPVVEPEIAEEEPAADPEPLKKEPVVESNPVKEEPVIEETPEKAPVKTVEEEVLEQVMSVTSFYDLEKTMKPLKEAGKITDFGKYTTIKDPANCYLIIYDQQAVIKAVLGKGTTSRKNMKSGLADSEKNYHGCGALWFKVKQ